jgi:type III secretion protein V
LKSGLVYVNDSAENIKIHGLDGEDMRNPADGSAGAWIPEAQRAVAEEAGLEVREPWEVLRLHLSSVLKRYAHEFVGIEEAQGCLNFAAQEMPKLIEEVVPKVVSLNLFAEVLKRLVQEGISIRDIRSILDALSQWGRMYQDPALLTESVRMSLKRYLSFKHTEGTGTLYYYHFDFEIEEIIRQGIQDGGGVFLKLNETHSKAILYALRRALTNLPPTAQKPVLVTEMELRHFVRDMVGREFPTLTVLSFLELTPDVDLQPLKCIALNDGWDSLLDGSDADEDKPPRLV